MTVVTVSKEESYAMLKREPLAVVKAANKTLAKVHS